MQLEARKYLHDMQRAANALARFTSDKTFADYTDDAMLRAAVERQFEIIGEALGQLAKRDAEVAQQIGGYRRMIAFRNILIHGYAEVDDALVWDIVESRLPPLRQQLGALLDQPE